MTGCNPCTPKCGSGLFRSLGQGIGAVGCRIGKIGKGIGCGIGGGLARCGGFGLKNAAGGCESQNFG